MGAPYHPLCSPCLFCSWKLLSCPPRGLGFQPASHTVPCASPACNLVWREPGFKLQIGKTPHTFCFLQTSSPWKLSRHSPELHKHLPNRSLQSGLVLTRTSWARCLRMLTPPPGATLPVAKPPWTVVFLSSQRGKALDAASLRVGSSHTFVPHRLPDHRQGLFLPVCPWALGPSLPPSLHWAQDLGISGPSSPSPPSWKHPTSELGSGEFCPLDPRTEHPT